MNNNRQVSKTGISSEALPFTAPEIRAVDDEKVLQAWIGQQVKDEQRYRGRIQGKDPP